MIVYLDQCENQCKGHCCFHLKEERVPVPVRAQEGVEEPQRWLALVVVEVVVVEVAAAQRYAKGKEQAQAEELD